MIRMKPAGGESRFFCSAAEQSSFLPTLGAVIPIPCQSGTRLVFEKLSKPTAENRSSFCAANDRQSSALLNACGVRHL
jgi:hypothetical protein